MNGPEHYAAAERILRALETEAVDRADAAVSGSLAQVHATLALAAAVRGPSDATWVEVLK